MKLEAIDLDVLNHETQANDNFLPEKRTYEDESIKVFKRQLAFHTMRKLEKTRISKYLNQISEPDEIIKFTDKTIQKNKYLLTKHDIWLLILTKIQADKDKIEKIINNTKKNIEIKKLIPSIIISESTEFKEIGESTFNICKAWLKVNMKSMLIEETWEQTRANLATHNSLKYRKPIYEFIFKFSNSKQSNLNRLPYSVLSENLTPFLKNKEPKKNTPKFELNWNQHTQQSNCSIL